MILNELKKQNLNPFMSLSLLTKVSISDRYEKVLIDCAFTILTFPTPFPLPWTQILRLCNIF